MMMSFLTVLAHVQVFVNSIESVEKQVQSIMGEDFFQLFVVSPPLIKKSTPGCITFLSYVLFIQSAPDKLYDALSPSHIDVLVGCLNSDTQ